MTTAGDFIRLSKTDSCNQLDCGMRPSSYVAWSGFYIPQVTEKEIEFYSKIRIKAEKDVKSLLTLSVNEALADNVKVLEGTVGMELMAFCSTPASFAEIVRNTVQKYSDRLELRPYLGINTDAGENMSLARSFISGGVFSGTDFYGHSCSEHPEYFAETAAELHEAGLRVKFNASHIESVQQLEKVLEFLKPDIISGFNNALLDQCADLLAAHKTEVCFSPDAQDVKETAACIKKLTERKISVKLGSSKILYHNHTLSDFASELCNTGLLSAEFVTSLFC